MLLVHRLILGGYCIGCLLPILHVLRSHYSASIPPSSSPQGRHRSLFWTPASEAIFVYQVDARVAQHHVHSHAATTPPGRVSGGVVLASLMCRVAARSTQIPFASVVGFGAVHVTVDVPPAGRVLQYSHTQALLHSHKCNNPAKYKLSLVGTIVFTVGPN